MKSSMPLIPVLSPSAVEETAAAQEEKERQILENERWMKAFLTNQEKNS